MAKYDHGGGCPCGLKKVCDCDDAAEADSRYVAQEGGDHYQSVYQHWDWVTDIGMGYLPGNATKYVSRWRKKNGVDDLKKAMTYVDKMIAIRKADDERMANQPTQFNNPVGNGYKVRVCTDRFTETNGLKELERGFCEILVGECDKYILRLAKERLAELIWTAQKAQERQPDAGGMVAPAAPSKPSLE